MTGSDQYQWKTNIMKKPSLKQAGWGAALTLALCGTALWATGADSSTPAAVPAPKPQPAEKSALAVNAVQPRVIEWPISVTANGNIAAWQEAAVGSELGGLRLSEVAVNVGDVVRKGQVLARFASASVTADVMQQQASLEEAEAALSEAQANAERARVLINSGALSGQMNKQYMTAAQSAKARLSLASARLKSEQIRLQQTVVVAPDDGVISARSAAVGAVVGQGQELFKLIRQNRLEWRVELSSADLLRVKPGQHAHLVAANGATVEGKVRIVGPSVDTATRNALVYVDLPVGSRVQSGMFATGSLELGRSTALAVPQSAVVSADGYNYVYRIGNGGKVSQVRVELGRRLEQDVELVSGGDPSMRLVARGVGFLNDGDTVTVLAPGAAPGAAQIASR